MAANNITFILKDRNVYIIEREWHMGALAPDIFYHYGLRLRPRKYKLIYQTKKFAMYERI